MNAPLPAPSRPETGSAPFWWFPVGCAALGLLTLLSYAGTFWNDFVNLDDNGYITQNPHVAAGLTPESIAYAWTTFDVGNWIPMTWMSFELDAMLYGIQPAGFHATSLLLHGVNALLLWIWLWRLTGAGRESWAVAALFAVHPLHVESVAWAAERKDLLSLLFFLGMLLAYESYSRRPTWWRYGLATLWLALGLLSKSMLVTAPFLLGLVDLWQAWGRLTPAADDVAQGSRRSVRLMILEKLPWLAMSVIIGIITVQAQGSGTVTAFTSFGRLPMEYRVTNAIAGYGWYVWRTLVPTGLCAMYAHPLLEIPWPKVIVSALGLLAITAYVAIVGRRRPALIFGWCWFVISLLPVIGLLQVGTQSYADRYSYLPQIGLLVMIVWELVHLIGNNPARQSIGVAALGLAVTVSGGLTMRQVQFWRDTDAMWARALTVDPENWAVHQWVGRIELAAGRYEAAARHFEMALRKNPRLPEELNALGQIYSRTQEPEAAIRNYRQTLAISAGHREAMHGLLELLRAQRRVVEAFSELQRYVERRPDDRLPLIELGLIFARKGDIESARVLFQQATTAEPEDFSARMNLGNALANLGRNMEAIPHLKKAVELRPDNADARVNLGAALQSTGAQREAVAEFEAALKINPLDQEALRRLEALR